MKDTVYYSQAELLLQILPFIAKDERFSLKGGTAINMFIRDMPRLSVDIDLCYTPIEDRTTSLTNITHSLQQIADTIPIALHF